MTRSITIVNTSNWTEDDVDITVFGVVTTLQPGQKLMVPNPIPGALTTVQVIYPNEPCQSEPITIEVKTDKPIVPVVEIKWV